MPSPLARHCPDGPNNRRTIHDQQVIRKQRGCILLLIEQSRVGWFLQVWPGTSHFHRQQALVHPVNF